jgi:hypothetical protein
VAEGVSAPIPAWSMPAVKIKAITLATIYILYLLERQVRFVLKKIYLRLGLQTV